MSARMLTVLTAILFALGARGADAAQTPECPLERPIMFGGLDWQSAAFHNALAREILETGYGCETDEIPGSTIPMLSGLVRGDIDVVMEVWIDRVTEVWDRGLRRGKVVSLGVNFPDARQGWYVPRYMVEGDPERGIEASAPDLRSVFDLATYRELFRDPENPRKGRFHNCILGWLCEGINTKKLYAYGLEDTFSNFRPGTSAALDAVIASKYSRGEPFVTYYWEPTWVIGKFDLIQLEEPAYDEQIWQDMNDQRRPEKAVAWPDVRVDVGVNTAFRDKAGHLVDFLTAYEMDRKIIAEALAWLHDNDDAEPRDAALRFLRTRRDLWGGWVPDDVAARLDAALAAGE